MEAKAKNHVNPLFILGYLMVRPHWVRQGYLMVRPHWVRQAAKRGLV